MSYEIEYLADHPHHLPTVAKWYWQEWDRHEGWDIERSTSFAEQGCNKDKLDIILIAMNDSQDCIGTIQLREEWGLGDEIPQKLREYSPWLGSLYVHPDYRFKKLGFDLCEQIKKAAIEIGIKSCYAATSHLDQFFKLRNGVKIDSVNFANEDMGIFKFSLN
ncbi:MAG: GNAT family N-acetyltransferase [Pseudomonadota bacterium]